MKLRLASTWIAAVALMCAACGGEKTESPGAASTGSDKVVVVYTALDRQFSEPILAEFAKASGIVVKPVYDTEAVKTVGLVNRLLAERERPQADVFWNNEIVRSIQLKREGLTEAYVSPSAADIPTAMKDAEGHWTGFAARARVFMVNTNLIPDAANYPKSLADLTDEKWKGKAAFAKPLFGTTSTHAAVMWATIGAEKSADWWRAAIANSIMEAGNAQAANAVANGEAAWCWTDTDDAFGAITDGKPVAIVYPDALPPGDGAPGGVLLLPNTLVLIKNGPNPEAARALIDFLLRPEVEGKLAQSRSAQIPVRAAVPGPPSLPPIGDRAILDVDWDKVADALAESGKALAGMVK